MIDNSQHDYNDRGDKDGGDSNSFHRGSFVFMEINERCIGIESCPNAFDPGGLIKYIRKSKRVKGIFSRVQWHLAEG